jgi:hypothetical protein
MTTNCGSDRQCTCAIKVDISCIIRLALSKGPGPSFLTRFLPQRFKGTIERRPILDRLGLSRSVMGMMDYMNYMQFQRGLKLCISRFFSVVPLAFCSERITT